MIDNQRAVDFKNSVKERFGSYGLYTYEFTPTAIGVLITIYSKLADERLDITDYDTW